MKRKIYAPNSKPIAGASSVPTNPYEKRNPANRGKVNKPFNAWAETLVGPNGIPNPIPVYNPSAPRPARDNKRKAEEEEEKEVLYDGVRFTAKKEAGGVTVVDEDKIVSQWDTNKLLCFTISKIDGSISPASKEEGEKFDFTKLKIKLTPICKPGFVSLNQSSREIAGFPSSSSKMDVTPSEFPVKLTAPPTIGSASDIKPASKPIGEGQEYPAKGTASFRDIVTDEILIKINEELGSFGGRKILWVRASG